MIRKLNLILCILIVLVFVGQIVMMFQPYFTYMPKVTLYEQSQGVVAEEQEYNLMQFVWTEWVESSNMDSFLIDGLKKADLITPGSATNEADQLGELSNSLVLGLVGITVLGAVVAIMTIFTRKSLIHYCFTLGWAACGLYTVLADNYVLKNMANEVGTGTVLPILTYLSIAGAVLVLLRAFPWFYSRFIYKEPIDLEALNA